MASTIAAWRPSEITDDAGVSARHVVSDAAPARPERAKTLLWASGRLAQFAVSIGETLEEERCLQPSTVERSDQASAA